MRTVGPDRRIRLPDSLLEHAVFHVVLARRDVVDLLEQPAPISYTDDLGRVRRHTFDAIVVFRDGTRIALVIKPSAIAVRRRTDGLVAHLARDLPRDVADGVLLMTERDVGRDELHDAKLVNGARLHARPEHDALLLRHMRAHPGGSTIAALCVGTGLRGDGLRAVARLIGDGTLARETTGRIGPETRVFLSEREADA